MNGMHNSLKSLKRDAILLLLFDIFETGFLIVKGPQWIVLSENTFAEAAVGIFLALFLNILWVVDSGEWIRNAFFRRCLWGYVLLEAALFLAVYFAAFACCFAFASILSYILPAYLILGIALTMHFL